MRSFVLAFKLIIILVPFVIFLNVALAEEVYEEDAVATGSSPTIYIDGVVYKDKSYDSRLNLDLPLSGGELFTIGVGYSQLKLAEASLVVQSVTAGLSSDQSKRFVYGGQYDVWGNETSLTTQRLAINLGFGSDSWQLNLQPDYRQISIYSEDFTPSSELSTRSRFDIDDYGLSLNLSYFGFENWGHRIHGSYHDYSQDMTRFDVKKFDQEYEQMIQQLKDRGLTDEQINFILYSDLVTLLTVANRAELSQQTITNILQLRRGINQASTVLDMFSDGISLSSSFEDYSIGYELGYYWSNWRALVDITRSHSVVTKDNYDSVSLGFGFDYRNWHSGFVYSARIDDLTDRILQLTLIVPLR